MWRLLWWMVTHEEEARGTHSTQQIAHRMLKGEHCPPRLTAHCQPIHFTLLLSTAQGIAAAIAPCALFKTAMLLTCMLSMLLLRRAQLLLRWLACMVRCGCWASPRRPLRSSALCVWGQAALAWEWCARLQQVRARGQCQL
jgi:hypothetical protein